MSRLFFGLRLPTRWEDSLCDVCEGVSEARWVHEDDFHLTLSFLGEVPLRQIQTVVDVARRVRSDPVQLSVSGVGLFPRRGNPRVMWAGVERSDSLILLKRRLDAELREIAFEPEGRKFRPHITLARLDRGRHPIELGGWISQHVGLALPEVTLAQFHLLESQYQRDGSRYATVESFPLRR